MAEKISSNGGPFDGRAYAIGKKITEAQEAKKNAGPDPFDASRSIAPPKLEVTNTIQIDDDMYEEVVSKAQQKQKRSDDKKELTRAIELVSNGVPHVGF